MHKGLEQLLSQFLKRSWHHINDERLAGVLRPPIWVIDLAEKRLGFWDAHKRTMGISIELMLNHSEAEVLEVLKHEMAHQYADEVLKSGEHGDETPHGSAFRHACHRLGIGHSARFQPQSEPPPLLRRIQKLLKLAESQNRHEAEAAMAKARALMEKYELDIGLEETEYRYTFLGKPRGRRSAPDKIIGAILASFFHVQIIWIPSRSLIHEKRLWLMEASGTTTSLEIAEYVYAYLAHEMEWLWLEHRRAHPGVSGRSLKNDFLVGLLLGLQQKLAEEEQASSDNASKSLIHLKREKLRGFFEQRHPSRRTSRGGSYRETDSFHAGLDKGRDLDLKKGLRGTKGGTRRLASG
ncbi:SprT-like domain-containing protein [Sulfidibacter corallicola]|uniref:SprT-like domain-containing protein n=1 Tax=Sulfidibacter corallicola TaxID=2818388 RepID=A0A8A4TT69_SULCO|nr:SprT-like domain-containing protein [Sulfidibacter corallicola]QTD53156.1 SprT-like domain-containing protein [Sulfidibacter corallicola]